MVHQHLVDLARAHLLAAAVDDLLEAAGDGEIAVGVLDALVAGAEPAVVARHRVGLGILQINLRHVAPSDHYLPRPAGAHPGRSDKRRVWKESATTSTTRWHTHQ